MTHFSYYYSNLRELCKYGKCCLFDRRFSATVSAVSIVYRMRLCAVRACLMCELAIVECRVKTASSQQLLMISLLDDVSVLHDENDIRLTNRG